jgi:NADH-quinone oxidoreductase subunit M
MTATTDTCLLAAAAITVVVPLVGSAAMAMGFRRGSPRGFAVAVAAVSLLASLAITLFWSRSDSASMAFGAPLGGGTFICIDGITAVLLPYVALVELAILLVAPRRSLEQSAVTRILFGAAATYALFLTSHPLVLVVLWCATALPTWISVRGTPGGRTAARVFAIAMAAATVCMAIGSVLLLVDPPWAVAGGSVSLFEGSASLSEGSVSLSGGWFGAAGGWLVAVAVMIRKGIFPFHSWYPALFSGATMSTALAATMPQVASYTAVRLLIGHADHPEGVAAELVVLSQLALVTAAYGAALAIVQRDLRTLIGVLAMSQSALVLGGLAGTLPMELNGAFCVWISSGLALTGIGLVSWALESRAGPIRLDSPQGRFWDAPELAAFFLLFGLAGIGLPGTLSFVADDLIVSGSLDEQLHAGMLVILANVFAGIAMMGGWFHVFGGPVVPDGPRHAILPRERGALTALLATLFLLGLWPGPLVRALDRATGRLLGVPGRIAVAPESVRPESVGPESVGRGAAAGLQDLPPGR